MKCIKYSSLIVLALAILTANVWSQTDTAAKPAKKKRAAEAAEPAVTAAEVQALRDAIAAQQRQIQQLSQQLQESRQEWQQAQSAASNASTKADAAQATAADQQQTVVALKSDVADLKTNVTNTALTLQETQKSISATESPLAIHYKGITITPGGFLAAETVRRSRALAADVNTPFNSITMPGASQSTLSEFFGSGRQSRISMLAEGKLKTATLTGYYEADFLSAAITSNNNQSNSYSLRQRQAWGQAAFDSGWSFTGGQMWSLLTETRHGVDNRTEAIPLTIDAQYQVGFSWARQYGIRLAKNFGNKAWFAVSMENSQATLTAHGNAANFLLGSSGAGSGLYNSGVTACSTSSSGVTTCTPAASYSFNPSPDVIAKVAFEPGFGHYEAFGVYSRFRDRVFPCEENFASTACGSLSAPSAALAFNSSKDGGGFGANARWTFAKHLDFGLHGFGGSGIGRYGSGGLADTTVNGDGTLHLLRGLQGMASLEWHGPKLDIYLYPGAEYAARSISYDPIAGQDVGYGSPTFSNSGCETETVPLSGSSNGNGFIPGSLSHCTADTRVLVEGTAGFWYRFYQGPKGRFQFGAQYSYVTRNTWSGVSTPGLSNEPHGIDGMVFTSFRYYLP